MIKQICPHSEYCGGCIYQGIPYEEQLRQKDKSVRTLLEKHKIDESVYLGMVPAITPYGYRNKMEYTFGDIQKGGELELGLHIKRRFMSIITTDECQIVPEDFNRVIRATLNFCRSRNYSFYHRKTHTGLLRNLVLRCGVRSNEILINIVTSSQEDFDEAEFKEMILNLDLDMDIAGIIRTFNDNVADTVTNEGVSILYGRDYYYETILGLKFKVNAFAFFQTNIEAIERLYSNALSLIPDIEGKTIFDLYCGTGTISQLMALKAAKVYGVEIVEDSIDAAIDNARLNNLDNCEFICGDVRQVISELDVKPDVIVVDPPRVGIHNKAVDLIAGYGVSEILYISCNPKTLCINLERFKEYGYEVRTMETYDNFPMTKHVEACALLSKLDICKHIEVKIDMDELDLTAAESTATYEQIREYVLNKFGFKVSTLYIAQIKRECGLELRENYSKSKKENPVIQKCPPEKREAILDALRYFWMV